MKIGDRVFVRGYIDEIRKDTVIIRNAGGYFGTIPSEVITGELPSAQPDSKELSFTHKALDTISRQDAIRIVDGIDTWQAGWRGDAIESMKALPTAQPETHEERTETHTCDCISRQAAINALTSHIMPHNNEDGTVTIGVLSKSSIKNILNKLPPAQPEQTNSWCINSWCIDCKEYDTENKCCPRYNRVIKQTLDDAYRHGETEAEARFHAQQMWIPCSEKLPEANGRYLVTRGLVAAGALWNRIYIANYSNLMGIKSVKIWWQGNVGKSDFERLDDVLAWMPLPEAFKEGQE